MKTTYKQIKKILNEDYKRDVNQLIRALQKIDFDNLDEESTDILNLVFEVTQLMSEHKRVIKKLQ